MIQKIKRTVILVSVLISMSSLVQVNACEDYCNDCAYSGDCLSLCKTAEKGTQQDKKNYKEFQEMHCPVQGMTKRSEDGR